MCRSKSLANELYTRERKNIDRQIDIYKYIQRESEMQGAERKKERKIERKKERKKEGDFSIYPSISK